MNRSTLFTLLSLGVVATSTAFAQDLDDPNIKVEFGKPAQGFRQSFDTEDGLRTKGRLQLGPDAVRLEIGNRGQAKLLKKDDKLDGAQVNLGLSTRITVPSDVTEEELRSAIAQMQRKQVFSAAINASAEVTKRNLGGTVDMRLGEEPETRKVKMVGTRIYLGPVYLNIAAVGATTEGGAAATGGLAVDLNWKEGTLTLGGATGLNLPKFLGGRGAAGGLIVQLELNTQFLKELKAAIDYVRTRLQSALASLRSAGRSVGNVFKGTRGPTVDVKDVEKIEVSGPAVNTDRMSPEEIAQRYAPVIIQPTDSQHDFLRRVDFDGDWNTKNNWDNSGSADYDKRGYAYVDVKETKTHFYVNYAFYYARREGNRLTRHENDMAMVTVIARKGAPLGQEVETVLTNSGNGLVAYQAKDDRLSRRNLGTGSRRPGSRTQEREYITRYKTISFVDEKGHPYADAARTHPQIWITAKSHNVYSFNGRDDRDVFTGKRGVIYQPGAQHVAPEGRAPTVGYALRPMTELKNASSKDGKLRGDEGADDSADLPWNMDSGLPGLVDGAILRNPARTMAHVFELGDDYSTEYLNVDRRRMFGATSAVSGVGR